MRPWLILGIIVVLGSSYAHASPEECVEIDNDIARLNCFDIEFEKLKEEINVGLRLLSEQKIEEQNDEYFGEIRPKGTDLTVISGHITTYSAKNNLESLTVGFNLHNGTDEVINFALGDVRKIKGISSFGHQYIVTNTNNWHCTEISHFDCKQRSVSLLPGRNRQFSLTFYSAEHFSYSEKRPNNLRQVRTVAANDIEPFDHFGAEVPVFIWLKDNSTQPKLFKLVDSYKRP